MTTRVKDKAYSLMGVVDVNMSMLYGEGKKAFHRLQLEIIRSSDDQSVFAWGHRQSVNVRCGSILADDPSFFEDCSDIEPMGPDEFIEYCDIRDYKQIYPRQTKIVLVHSRSQIVAFIFGCCSSAFVTPILFSKLTCHVVVNMESQ